MFDYTVYANTRAVRILRLSFIVLMTLWNVVMFQPAPHWILTFGGIILMCNPYAGAELLTGLLTWRVWLAAGRLRQRCPELTGRLNQALRAASGQMCGLGR